MGRKVAIPWHATFSIAAGVLYFFFVLPRWPELMGDTTHSLGTALRIAAGALFALAALPVVFNLLRVRKPELGTPQLALTLRVASIVAHVLAGVLIIGTAISEIWLSLDAAGQYLFAIYGAAAAIAVLGFFAFYLSFVAELPPPPPKPIKAKKPKKRRLRRKEGEEADTEEEAEEEAEDADESEAEDAEAEAEETETVKAETSDETEVAAAPEPAEETAEATEETEDAQAKLRNRRPTGKGSHRMRRRRTRGGVALDED
ncbi:hypothetical protein AWC17_01455 [Mycobacterium nebraskense]|uniref:Transmembrane protein n=1 Tax=Mycobacterium nebraskense TaxID=244292 RepID=A0A1X1ZRC5_9MYCO|nr:hypothetical protein [Mycobacterium nebraskense]KKC01632.1 membrane protein [Mycobacterium nebraskense]MCV7120185.1 hypothetical protein [Mycobacterium nebraskense]ORW25855.1 hypothetical protein AWC17_01455 [Mycobacterium nebraskense]